jgi:hypothetical protein
MEFETKTREEVGEEQTDRFGREDMDSLKRKIYPEKPKNTTPSIYELMKKKEERDKKLQFFRMMRQHMYEQMQAELATRKKHEIN